jgi:FkbM family methyltransferase
MTQPASIQDLGLLARCRRFLRLPLHEKSISLYARWRKRYPSSPFPIRLPFGAWFIARGDTVGSMLAARAFEADDRAFVACFLQPGMTVIDAGAHQGLYTLLMSKRVGARGRVYSFEPSPRERQALRLNVRINRLHNVWIQPFALGNEESISDLYVVNKSETGCNSLRPPDVSEPLSTTPVQVRTLDGWLASERAGTIDFIKLDVEGAELSVLKGAAKFLSQHPRPLIMAEVETIRTKPWGYSPHEIIELLEALEFSWFKPAGGGRLAAFDPDRDPFVGNFIAVPAERRDALLSQLPSSC